MIRLRQEFRSELKSRSELDLSKIFEW